MLAVPFHSSRPARLVSSGGVPRCYPMSFMGFSVLCARNNEVRFVPISGRHRQDFVRPKSAISGSHSILVAPGEHLAPMVIQAARLAATLLRIARRLRHAGK